VVAKPPGAVVPGREKGSSTPASLDGWSASSLFGRAKIQDINGLNSLAVQGRMGARRKKYGRDEGRLSASTERTCMCLSDSKAAGAGESSGTKPALSNRLASESKLLRRRR
jgi:hypothetical protein